MEELNNVQEVITEAVEPMEILDVVESTSKGNSSGFAIGAVIGAGLLAGAYGVKKLIDWKKSKNASNSETAVVLEEVPVETQNEETIIE